MIMAMSHDNVLYVLVKKKAKKGSCFKRVWFGIYVLTVCFIKSYQVGWDIDFI